MPLQVEVQTPDPEIVRTALAAARSGVARVIEERSFGIVYQPILDLRSGRIRGYECLTRFRSEPVRTPDLWFAEAADVGLGVSLELQTFKAALRDCGPLPKEAFVALNVSPQAVVSGWISAVLKAVDPKRVVLELTEHAPVADYGELRAVLDPLREKGVRIAVDDVGSGYANLQHILALRPDIVKIDIALTRDVDVCSARAALMGGLVEFGRTIGADILAEGVETEGQLAALRTFGVDMVQGWLTGRPEPAETHAVLRRDAENVRSGTVRSDPNT